jgi:hypothetical protein
MVITMIYSGNLTAIASSFIAGLLILGEDFLLNIQKKSSHFWKLDFCYI